MKSKPPTRSPVRIEEKKAQVPVNSDFEELKHSQETSKNNRCRVVTIKRNQGTGIRDCLYLRHRAFGNSNKHWIVLATMLNFQLYATKFGMHFLSFEVNNSDLV